MPRKQSQKVEKVAVVVDGKTTVVTLHPPTKARKSWYAFWNGLVSSKSTGHTDLKQAIQAVERMVAGKGDHTGDRPHLLTDQEFDEIQRRHFSKHKDPDAAERAEKSLIACMEAISAFRAISGLTSIALATPDDCERFQHMALEKPKNWRCDYPNKQDVVEKLSPNTVVKWSVALQAAFERANRNGGKKCVRGVAPADRLLVENPWRMFTGIKGREKVIRQFSGSEINSMLDHFESDWADVPVGSLLAKVLLWSAARKSEVTSLRWNQLRQFADEYHFQIKAKKGVERWFRIPAAIIQELHNQKTADPFVFSAYNNQLRRRHERGANSRIALQVSDHFTPSNLADWFYERLGQWATAASVPPVNIHVFRKTSLQYARIGEDVNRQVAHDASVGERVMMGSYVKESDVEMRQRSNRTFHRIANGFGPDLATRLGWKEGSVAPAQAIKVAIEANDWDAVLKLAAQMAAQKNSASAAGQSL